MKLKYNSLLVVLLLTLINYCYDHELGISKLVIGDIFYK
jgi:hypothetical protein